MADDADDDLIGDMTKPHWFFITARGSVARVWGHALPYLPQGDDFEWLIDWYAIDRFGGY